MKLLLIEDSRDICLALSKALAAVYDVDCAMTGEDGLSKALAEEYVVIILDLHLPDSDGLDICRRIRQFDRTTPILILSGEHKVLTKIALMDAGADDYLTKPFSLGELKARLRSLERRFELGKSQRRQYDFGGIQLDAEQHTVRRDNTSIQLRRKEFALLECLIQHAGSVVSRQTLCAYAWKNGDDPWTNTVDVHIKYLRDKIDRPFEQNLIKTIHGVGYKLDIPVSNVPVVIGR